MRVLCGVEQRLGLGYDHLLNTWKQETAVEGELVDPSAINAAAIMSFQKLTSVSEVNTALDFRAEVSVGFGLTSGDATFNLKEECRVNEQSSFVAIKVEAEGAYSTFDRPRLTSDAATDAVGMNPNRFRQVYGDHYISGIKRGGRFYGIARVESKNIEKQREIASKIAVSYGMTVQGEAEISSVSSSLDEETRVECFSVQAGGSVSVARGPEGLLRAAIKFADDINRGETVPFYADLAPLTHLRNFPDVDLREFHLDRQRRYLSSLRKDFSTLCDFKNEIDFAKRNYEWFLGLDMNNLNSVGQKISSELDKISDQIILVSRDPAGAQSYSPSFPRMPQLRRREGAPEAEEPPAPFVPFVRPSPEVIRTIIAMQQR